MLTRRCFAGYHVYDQLPLAPSLIMSTLVQPVCTFDHGSDWTAATLSGVPLISKRPRVCCSISVRIIQAWLGKPGSSEIDDHSAWMLTTFVASAKAWSRGKSTQCSIALDTSRVANRVPISPVYYATTASAVRSFRERKLTQIECKLSYSGSVPGVPCCMLWQCQANIILPVWSIPKSWPWRLHHHEKF
jgi:hypothetical protein